MHHPWRAIASLTGVEVIVTRLDGDRWGYYDADENRIYIDSRLRQGERRSTLVHETVHVERGDAHIPCATDWHDRKQERAVDVEAARRLVPLAPLADALAWTTDEWEI